VNDDLEELRAAFLESPDELIDRAFRQMIHNVCVRFGKDRVASAILGVLFMRMTGIAATETMMAVPAWFDLYDDTDGILDPPMFDGLPMRLAWDYFGSEFFPNGQWTTSNWFRYAGFDYQSPDP
jgi:hypothetical protein